MALNNILYACQSFIVLTGFDWSSVPLGIFKILLFSNNKIKTSLKFHILWRNEQIYLSLQHY